MKVNSVPLQGIIDEVIEDLSLTDAAVKRDLFTRWGYDIAKTLPTDEQLIPLISLIQVTNYKGKLPNNWRLIDEVGALVGEQTKKGLKAYFNKFTQEVGDGCEVEISLKCPRCHQASCDCDDNTWAVDITPMMRTNFPTVEEFNSRFGMAHTTNSMFSNVESGYSSFFKIIQPSINYTEMYKQHLPECINLCTNSEDKYNIVKDTIETTFKEGLILFSYMGYDTDANGDISIPDITESIECVKEYLIYKHFRTDFLRTSSRESHVKYKESEMLYKQKYAEARSKLGMPGFKEISQIFRASRLNKLNNAYGNLLKGRNARNLSRHSIYRSR